MTGSHVQSDVTPSGLSRIYQVVRHPNAAFTVIRDNDNRYWSSYPDTVTCTGAAGHTITGTGPPE